MERPHYTVTRMLCGQRHPAKTFPATDQARGGCHRTVLCKQSLPVQPSGGPQQLTCVASLPGLRESAGDMLLPRASQFAMTLLSEAVAMLRDSVCVYADGEKSRIFHQITVY